MFTDESFIKKGYTVPPNCGVLGTLGSWCQFTGTEFVLCIWDAKQKVLFSNKGGKCGLNPFKEEFFPARVFTVFRKSGGRGMDREGGDEIYFVQTFPY